MKKLFVHLGDRSYPILIEKGLLEQVGEEIKKIYAGRKIFVVTDVHVNQHYGRNVLTSLEHAGFQVDLLALPAGEETKSFHILPKIYNQFLDFKLSRSDLIIALGGGVIGDIVGFAASTYLRGVPYVQIPTSLLAQVDSSVGGKVAVDLDRGKNLVGSFYHPKLVLIDPNVLHTLEERFFWDGMAEVIKYGCIKDVNLFNELKNYQSMEMVMERIENIIYRCCEIKKEVVEEDEKDTGNRMLLNFGHTLGHAIETFYQYKKYTHGEAVAIGMYEISKRAEEKGLTEKGVAEQIMQIVQQYHLPYQLEIPSLTPILETIQLDKKNINDVLHVILLKRIGESYIKETTIDFFK